MASWLAKSGRAPDVAHPLFDQSGLVELLKIINKRKSAIAQSFVPAFSQWGQFEIFVSVIIVPATAARG